MWSEHFQESRQPAWLDQKISAQVVGRTSPLLFSGSTMADMFQKWIVLHRSSQAQGFDIFILKKLWSGLFLKSIEIRMLDSIKDNEVILTVTMWLVWLIYLRIEGPSQTMWLAGQPINQCSKIVAPSLVAASTTYRNIDTRQIAEDTIEIICMI